MKARSFWLLIPILILLAGSGCSVGAATGQAKCDGAPATTSHGGPACDYVSFVDQLRATGATVTPTGSLEPSFFSVGGYAITADTETIQVYEFANKAAMAAEAAAVSPDGYTVGHTQVSWVAPPHFYRAGRIIVVYAGSDATTLQRLSNILGPQFAGK